MRGVFPGSFSPPTVAHLHIAAAAKRQHGLTHVEFVLSESALAKPTHDRPSATERCRFLNDLISPVSWLSARLTKLQLLVDIAEGFDLLILGADKWHQIQDPVFYSNSIERRDEALSRLPRVALAPRSGWDSPAEVQLLLPESLAQISSTQVRAGAVHLAATETTVQELLNEQ